MLALRFLWHCLCIICAAYILWCRVSNPHENNPPEPPKGPAKG